MLIRDIIARMRHDGCGGRTGKVELLTGIEGASSLPARSLSLPRQDQHAHSHRQMDQRHVALAGVDQGLQIGIAPMAAGLAPRPARGHSRCAVSSSVSAARVPCPVGSKGPPDASSYPRSAARLAPRCVVGMRLAGVWALRRGRAAGPSSPLILPPLPSEDTGKEYHERDQNRGADHADPPSRAP